MPFNFLGSKLATTTTFLPGKLSGEKCKAIPLTMVLISKPKSTFKTSNLSALGTAAASRIIPVLKSSFAKSSKVIFGFKGG